MDTDMGSWTETCSEPRRRVWKRPLGVTEAVFYWDGVFNGIADTVMHVHLKVARPEDADMYACENVRGAWASVKRRFPLLAAEVEEVEEGTQLRFIVHEEKVTGLRNEDITFATVSSPTGADHFLKNLLDAPRPLSSGLLARIYVLRRTDVPLHAHVVLTVAHCITDGCSTSTILRTFFQTMGCAYDPVPLSIAARLDMCLPVESRIQGRGVSLPRQRWYRAIGYALHAVRLGRFHGGHTLPGRFTTMTRHTPAQSRFQHARFPRDVSSMILANCRRYGITLTCAYYALSQVALSRVLCRRYLRGEISEKEWAYRRREPMFFNGPINLRPYQDETWFEEGGSGEVGINVSFCQYVLPFMPLGVMSSAGKEVGDVEMVDGAPVFGGLMSFGRFLHRCGVVRRQMDKVFRHARFVEMCVAGYQFRVAARREAAMAWRATEARTPNEESVRVPVQALGPTITQVGSSLGNMDEMLPVSYPLPESHALSPLSPVQHPHRAGYVPIDGGLPVLADVLRDCAQTRLRVESWRTHLRTRPGELYLGASTTRGQLEFFAFYDGQVFDSADVAEWMGEVTDAVKWYLGEHRRVALSKL